MPLCHDWFSEFVRRLRCHRVLSRNRAAHARQSRRTAFATQPSREAEVLEGRTLLTVITIPATGGQHTIEITGGNLVVRDSSTTLYSTAIATPPTQIIINGTAGDDELIVDFAGGNPIPVDGIVFNGAAGNDSLTLNNGSTSSVTHAPTSAADGAITLFGMLAGTISYTGLEPITDNLDAAIRVFNFNGGAESISLVDAAGGYMTVDSDLSESITFANPTTSLAINAGVGDDSVTITSLDAAFNADFSIEGGDGADSVTIDANISMTTAHLLDVNGDTITLNGSVSTAGGVLGLNSTGDIVIANAISTSGGNMTIAADSDSDDVGTLTVSGSGSLDAGSGNIAITAADIALGGNGLAGTGTLSIEPSTLTSTIGLGAATGALQLSATELATLADGFSSIAIGGASQQTQTENFSSTNVPTGFDLQGSNAAFDGSNVAFNGSSDPNRTYLQTLTNHFDQSFVAEVNVILDNDSVAYFGMGNGERNPLWFYEPTPPALLTVMLGSSIISGRIATSDRADDQNDNGVASDIGFFGTGTHRVRITWDATAQTMVFAYDRNYAGGAFTADLTAPSLNGADNGFPGNVSHIFFGGQNGVRFDDFSISSLVGSSVSIDGASFTDPLSVVATAISVTGLDAGSNTIDLLSYGAITDAGDSTTDIAGGVVSVTSSGAIGASGNAVSFDVGSLTTNTSAANAAQFLSAATPVDIASGDLNAGTGTITLSSGTFLTASGGDNIVSPVVVQSGATLAGTGATTSTVSAQSGGHIAPGMSPGILSTGSVAFASGSNFDVEIDGTAGAGVVGGHDQLDVTGSVSLGGAILNVSLNYAPTDGDSFVIINNDGSDAVSGTFNVGGVAIGDNESFLSGSTRFVVDYTGGTNSNDVVLSVNNYTTEVRVSGSNLLINDVVSGGQNDDLTLQADAANSRYVIHDPNALIGFFGNIAGASVSGDRHTAYVPYSSVSGNVQVTTQGGDDSLTVDLSLGDSPRAISFDGGTQTTSDSLTLEGGSRSFAAVTHTATSASSGTVAVTGNGTVTYSGLEPITDNLDASIRVFTFNGGGESVTLSDAAGSAMTIDSDLSESITFALPTDSLTLNAGNGNDTVVVSSVDAAFNVNLTINGGTGDDSISLNASIAFAVDQHLDVNLEDDAVTPGVDSITVGAAAALTFSGTGSATLAASRSITLSTGASIATVNGDISLTANAAGTTTGSFDGIDISGATLQTTGTGDIALTGTGGLSGTSHATHGVYLHDGASVTSTANTADAGTITIDGTAGTGGFNFGVLMQGTTTDIQSVAGDIAITGTGADGATDNYGVMLDGIETISSTGTGANAAAITIVGTGGNGSTSNAGVNMHWATTDISTVDGPISITGQAHGTHQYNIGIYAFVIEGIRSTGTGTITLNGTGGEGTYGNVGTATHGSTITSVSGAIDISGQGGGTTTDNYGVVFSPGSEVRSTGTGATAADIKLTGTAGGGNSATNDGVLLLDNNESCITSIDGDIHINGTGGTSQGNGIEFSSVVPFAIQLTGDGELTLEGDGTGGLAGVLINAPIASNTGAISIQSPGDDIEFAAGTVSSTSGDVTIVTSGAGAITSGSAATDITVGILSLTAGSGGIGSNGNPLTFNATSLTTNTDAATDGDQYLAEADSVEWNDSTADGASISISSGTFLTGSTQTITAATVTIGSGTTLGGTGTVSGSVSVQSGGTVAPGVIHGVLSVGDVSFQSGSNFDVSIGGPTPGESATDHDQLQVVGTVTLGSANLNASVSYSPPNLTTFVIIDNDDADAVVGTFKVGGVSIPDGGGFLLGSNRYVLNYDGGDGNDVTLTLQNLDLGDAPTAAQSGFAASYPVALADNGAGHAPTGPQLGAQRDTELSAATSANADGDDLADLDDEDGISFVSTLIRSPSASTSAAIVVSLVNPDASSNLFSGWIDFNRDGDWSDAGEHVIDNVNLGTMAADVVLSFSIPAGAIIGDTFARFRLSTAGQSDVTGIAPDGEVEDYKVTVVSSSAPASIDVPASGSGSGDLYTSIEGTDIVVRQGGPSGTVLLQTPATEATQIDINGLDNVSEIFVVDFDNGTPVPPGGLNIDGGAAGNDMLQIAGDGEHAIYTPDAIVTGAGVVTVDGTQIINFTGLEPLDLFGFATVTLDLPSDDDVLTLTDDVDFTQGGINPAIRIAGTSGGVAIETVAVWNTTTLIIDTALTLNGADSITVTGADATAAGITNLTINTGAGADSFALDGNVTAAGALVILTPASITQAGTSTLTIGGTTAINTGSAALTLNTATNDFGGAVTLSGGAISIVDENDLTLANVTGSSVIASADDGLTLTGTLDAGAGTVTLNVNTDHAGADDFTMQPGSSIVTTNDTAAAVSISVNSLLGGTGDATLETISTGTTAGRVTIAAADGSILDGNAAALNVTSAHAVLIATGGVGTALDPIELSVSKLEGAGGTGGFFVSNNQSLTIGGITAAAGVSTTTGAINVTSAGALDVAEFVIGGGFVVLSAAESGGADNLTVNSGVAVSSTGSDVELRAGDNITLVAGSLTEAPSGTVFIKGDDGNADGLGSNITIDGLINSANGATVNGDSNADIITVTAMGSGGLLLDGLGSNDSYILTYPDLPTTFGSTITIDDSVSGDDQVTVYGTNFADDIYLTTQDPPTTPTTEELSRGGVGTEVIVLNGNLEGLSVFLLDEIDVMHAQPSLLFPVFLDGGDPCFGDPGVPPGDQLVFDPLGNSFSIAGNVIQTDGGLFFGVSFTDFESLPLAPVGAPPGGELLLDFNHTNTASTVTESPTQAGYISVPQETLYSGGLGYGWQTAVKSFERDNGFYDNSYSDLIRDGHWFDAPATFTVDLPNGWYLVSAMIGSPYTALGGVSIKNADTGGTLVSNITTDPGESKSNAFVAYVGDGTLDLHFVPGTTNPKVFAVNGLSIRPGVLLSMGLDCPTSSDEADGVTVDSLPLYEAPANSLITVTASNGTIMNVDEDDELDGIQIRTDALGQANVLLRRPTAAGSVVFTFEEVTGAKTGVSSVTYVAPSTRLVDFNHVNRASGTGQSPTQAPVAAIGFPNGFNGVPESQIYSALNGIGWLTSPRGFDLGGLTNSQGEAVTDPNPLADLRRDGAYDSAARSFRMQLPNGSYNYTATIGYDRDIDGMQIDANGSIVSGISVAAGQRQQINGTFNVAGGLATFTFSDAAGTAPNWVINGLEIRPVVSVTPINFAPNVGTTPADGITITPVSASTTLPDGEQVTVSTTLGTIVSPDVNPTVDGIQVLVSSGQIVFNVLAATIPGTPTFTATSLDGSHVGTIAAAAFFNFGIPTGRRFDFNHLRSNSSTGPSKTAIGFVGVLRTDLDRAADGFGWDIAPNSYDDAVPNEHDNSTFPQLTTALYSDWHSGHTSLGSRTFSVQVKPGTAYDLTVYLGEGSHDISTLVTVEGVVLPQSLDLGAEHYDFLQFVGATDADADGFIEITFTSTGAISPFWAVNGLDIVEAGSGLPLPAPLTAREGTLGNGAELLTESELLTVYQAALEAWGETGLTPAESALLSTVRFVIRDLGNSGALAYIDGNNVINLDDDALQHGWNLRLDEPLADRYDLLTVIAHELGHLLGRDDLNPNTAGDELMNAFLGLGERHDILEGIDGFFAMN